MFYPVLPPTLQKKKIPYNILKGTVPEYFPLENYFIFVFFIFILFYFIYLFIYFFTYICVLTPHFMVTEVSKHQYM